MRAARLFLITGKGGTGKTTVSAALGLLFARRGERTLLIETASDGTLAQCFGLRRFAAQPQCIQESLFGVRVDPASLLEHYVARLLPLRWLAQRLLASSAFRALSAAAPGVSEFLLLERIAMWVDPGFWQRRERYRRVIVDGPATGHMLHLLKSPRQLLNLVPSGPLHRSLVESQALLSDRSRTCIVVVSLPEELAIQETIEAYRVLEHELLLPLAPVVVNRVPTCPFTEEERARIAAQKNGGPLFEAARFVSERRALAEALIARLRREISREPILLAEREQPPHGETALLRFARDLRPLFAGNPTANEDLKQESAPSPHAFER